MSDEQPTRGFQFGLRHVIVTMAVSSVAFALLFVAPGWVTVTASVALSTLATAGLTAGIIYGGHDARAFCVGAMFPVALAAVIVAVALVSIAFNRSMATGYFFRELSGAAYGTRFVTVAGSIMAPAAGILSVIVRRRLSRDE